MPAAHAQRAPVEGAIVPRWLVGLRWATLAILAVLLPVGERFFGFGVRYAVAVPALLALVAFNVRAARRIAAGTHETHTALGASVALDLVALAVVLAASGGAANPMSALFLVHVALAASLLPARTTFALSGLSACLFAALFALPSEGGGHEHHAHHHASFSNHLYGMWLAFVLSAGLVAYVLTRVRRALDEKKAEVFLLAARAEENARFAALGTLAAGTAHELATPLGTIAVLAGEIAEGGTEAEAVAHARGIAAQVARCREVITRMQAGSRNRAACDSVEVEAVVARAVAAWRAAHPDVPVELRGNARSKVSLAADELEAALCALLDNALSAMEGTSERAPIAVVTDERDATPSIAVEDSGRGVPAELLGRLGEPFLTTKEPGEGMGLGLFLARTLVEQVGGRLEVSARSPHGTRVTLHLAGAAR